MAIAAMLLAAGESTRMGRLKALLDWHGQTLIEYQIHELLAAGADAVIVVLGHRADELRPLAERAGAQVALNLDYRAGRAGSIRVGAEALPEDVTAIVILSVDQPRDRAITATLLAAHRAGGNLITVPAYQGRRGHPAILAGALLSELRSVDEESEGLRSVMRRHVAERVDVPVDDPTVLFDLNQPSDYEAARRRQ